MNPATRRLEAPEAERLLASLAEGEASWPPGPSYVLSSEAKPSALVRLGDPEPGEGHHREHLRLLRGAGDESILSELTRLVVGSGDERWRLETECSAHAPWAVACEAAGLRREAVLPAGWRPEGSSRAVDLESWGRPGRRLRGQAPATPVRRAGTVETPTRLVVHDESTREVLAAFLDGLVPGRSYPPGVFLSDAERAETRRSGDLDADWLLALDPDGRVAGGVVLEPDGRAERRHVRRLHVDVSPDFRGRGLASRLLRAARELAAELGVERVEADPRSGHRAVIAALENAGLVDCGRQLGAWRMRTAAASWDEDVVLLSAPTAGARG